MLPMFPHTGCLDHLGCLITYVILELCLPLLGIQDFVRSQKVLKCKLVVRFGMNLFAWINENLVFENQQIRSLLAS